MNDLIIKGEHLEATKYGAFSKNGYHDNVLDDLYDLVNIEDFYS